jgi:hypothetical protein
MAGDSALTTCCPARKGGRGGTEPLPCGTLGRAAPAPARTAPVTKTSASRRLARDRVRGAPATPSQGVLGSPPWPAEAMVGRVAAAAGYEGWPAP